jgi:hypothetical protein
VRKGDLHAKCVAVAPAWHPIVPSHISGSEIFTREYERERSKDNRRYYPQRNTRTSGYFRKRSSTLYGACVSIWEFRKTTLIEIRRHRKAGGGDLETNVTARTLRRAHVADVKRRLVPPKDAWNGGNTS